MRLRSTGKTFSYKSKIKIKIRCKFSTSCKYSFWNNGDDSNLDDNYLTKAYISSAEWTNDTLDFWSC